MNKPIQAIDTHSVMFITPRPDVIMVEGKGSWLVDNNGKRYLDFLQGWAVNCLGHGNPGMIEALNAQAKKLINPSPAFYNEPMIGLSNLLTTNSCFNKVFFANSGAEANEGAIKLARKWGQLNKSGAFEIITFDHSFHGRTLATMSASGKPNWDTMFAPQVAGFPKADLNDLESVKKLVTDKTVAVMIEPVQGEGGVIPATQEFMRELRKLTKENNILLICDEVQAGCGRTGTLFAYQHYGIKPDIMTLGKGIGGGVPLAALLATDAVACFVPGDQGGTYNGNPLMTAVGISVIEQLLAPGFLDSVKAKGELLKLELLELSAEFGLEGERGEGLLRALMLGNDIGGKLVELARERSPEGLLINSPRPNLLRFMPALNVSDDEILQMCGMLRELLKEVA
ncbi:acetylornithine transaminase [Polynucleobacter asymbioticus]|jgi:acetylornithine/N-succinyldiaminopimelate aminotransferase|uniref:Acetylornithine aminotransferase n=2 Tax=Polynucleobacter asymbioticus TaxID=576611 RepID=A4SZM4_POLAQ|nr:acetylornithine transaminase [Polynucleobacter asymbioticus]ABP34938.1 acetylornithine aminotransferase apoenzyme [Polynucleobacter asymbioticus QLW-P1DMWA-1]APB99574.1 acetylornithine aminotransferase [Polynucleobacter asymbioticus]APC01880.1 acetylornithine aminotransferase [Polynucleobacter asymbioticus]APC06720.1 acetylornithine aminotransferase [Polynucleobacter asymbioticus]